MMLTGKLFVSPFVRIVNERNRTKVCNTVNGKTFEAGPEIIKVLKVLKFPLYYQELLNAFDEYRQSLPWMTKFLLAEGIIMEKGREEIAMAGITPVYEKIFNLPNYSPRTPGFKVPFVGIPFGRGNPRSIATGKFPWHVRELTHKLHLNFHPGGADGLHFESIDTTLDFDALRALIKDGALTDCGNIFMDMNESSNFIYDKIYAIAKTFFKADTVPFFIGGDHSISYPLIKAAAEKYDRLHILHFDAHTDTYTLPSDGIDHDGKTHHHGNFIYKCLEDTAIAGVHQLGIRGVSNLQQQEELPRQHIYWCSHLKKLIAEGGELPLPDDVPWYVTFDIDVLDPAFAPGTATPVPRGFTPEEIQKLLRLTLRNKHIVGFDLVEASQEHDERNITTEYAIEIILSLLSCINKEKNVKASRLGTELEQLPANEHRLWGESRLLASENF
jgi:agmatinase